MKYLISFLCLFFACGQQQSNKSSADKMYELILSLNEYEHQYSVYPFGEFVHYTDQRDDFNPDDLSKYLENKGMKNIRIKQTQTTIEDAFMELAK